ncbi:MAG: DUF5519 family protein [Pleurocapsa sp.]
MENITETIKNEVLSWSEVTSGTHRFGGLEFRIGNCEIGHLHGRHQVDIPFSARLRRELIATKKASPHHLYPNSGWISFYIHGAEDVPDAISLLRLNYDRLSTRRCGR